MSNVTARAAAIAAIAARQTQGASVNFVEETPETVLGSNTFSLALEGTGIYKSQVSSLLVMAILGGAILPPVQGWVADHMQSIQLSFLVPLIAYAYVAFYGAIGHRIGRGGSTH